MIKETWTSKEIQILKREYPVCDDPRDLIATLGKPIDEIRAMAIRLGLKREKSSKHWVTVLDPVLKELYPTHKNKEIAKRLRVSEKEVRNRATKLGLRKSPRPDRLRKYKPHHNKYIWTEQQDAFIRTNWHVMKNSDIALAFGVKLTLLRMHIYEMGLKRMRLEYWTVEQIEFLTKKYQTIGDKELAEIFNSRWHKDKGWSHKHIEKKRRYLKLMRTDEEKAAIQQRNVDQGRFLLCPVKRWATTGQAAEGELRMWRRNDDVLTPMIKINGRFIHWGRWAWRNILKKRIPREMCVVFKDNNPHNHVVENLELISRTELGSRNVARAAVNLSDGYVAGMMSPKDPALRKIIKENPSLIESKRQQLLLNRQIHEIESNPG